MSQYFAHLKELTRESIAMQLQEAKEKGELDEAVSRGIRWMIAQTGHRQALESILLPILHRYMPIEELYGMYHDKLTQRLDSPDQSAPLSQEELESWASVACAFGRYVAVRDAAYADAARLLSLLAFRLFCRIGNRNEEDVWRTNQSQSHEMRAAAERVRKLPGLACGRQRLNAEESANLKARLTGHYDYGIREDAAYLAGLFGQSTRDMLQACAKERADYAQGDECRASLAFIALGDLVTLPLGEALALLSPEARPTVQCALLLRLRGRVRALCDGSGECERRLENLLAVPEPAIAAAAMSLLCECYSVDRICQIALWMLAKRSDALTAILAMRVLFATRNVWIRTAVGDRLRTWLETAQPDRHPAWPLRAAAAGVMGCCGLKDGLLALLANDPSFDMRIAAYRGLGGVDGGMMAKPMRKAGDLPPEAALDADWTLPAARP